jgi:hypothetical protein
MRLTFGGSGGQVALTGGHQVRTEFDKYIEVFASTIVKLCFESGFDTLQ